MILRPNAWKMSSDFYVYQWCHPKTFEPAYVGKGIGNRAIQHLNIPTNRPFYDWLMRHPDAKLIYLRGGLTESEAYDLEVTTIESIGRRIDESGPLFNVRRGGEDEITHGQPVDYGGHHYISIADVARSHGLSEFTLYSRLRYGYTIEEALGEGVRQGLGNATKIEFRGISYASLAELAKAHGVGPTKFRGRRARGWTIEQALDLEDKPTTKNQESLTCEGQVRPAKEPKFVCWGEPFDSYLAISKDPRCIVSRRTVGPRHKNGWSLEDAAETRARQGHVVKHEGKTYGSIRAFAKDTPKSYQTILRKLQIEGVTPEQAAKKEYSKAHRVELEGRTFETLVEASDHYKISSDLVRMRLHRRWTLNQAFGLSKRPPSKSLRPVVCLDTGEVFPSATEAAQSKGCDPSGIGKVCRGHKEHIRGLRWAFLNEDDVAAFDPRPRQP